MNRFILLYDCPLRKCDKIWLYNGLRKYRETKVVSTLSPKSYFEISRFMPKIRIGKIIRIVLVCGQSLRAVILANKGDIIVTWSRDQGCAVEALCRILKRDRKIVSFNWLGLPDKNVKLITKCFKDNNFMPIINNMSLYGDFVRLFKLKKWNGVFLPDVFDDKISFEEAKYRYSDKYIFAGGVNNRDWETLLEVARNTPKLRYIIVSNKGDIKECDKKQLFNVEFKESISACEYYRLMKKSFITVCPLRDDRTSGLINIIRSSQFGIPCISTQLSATGIYYSNLGKKKLLFKRGDWTDLKQKIVKLCDSGESEYIKIVEDFQSHIKTEFNPDKNVKKLISELQKRKWLKDGHIQLRETKKGGEI